MQTLTPVDLFSLEEYAEKRAAYRQSVMAHKKNRKVTIGKYASLYFEDRLTMQYQIQEMLRIERIFEADAINEELETYNPLIPDGCNLKATFMLEYTDIDMRKKMLKRLLGIEKKVWIQVEGEDKVYPIANEDLDRETDEKTSAVHFLRFEFNDEMISAAKQDAVITIGIDHTEYQESVEIPENVHQSLIGDLD